MKSFLTPQENFWAGEFGSSYIGRNQDDQCAIAHRVGFWSKIVQHMTFPPASVLELGANVGINLDALKILFPHCQLSAVEINADAVQVLRQKKYLEVFHDSILSFSSSKQWDVVFTSGVLIHLNPEYLSAVYDLMAKTASRYVVIAEYYNPSPVEVSYRGYSEKLFKRDFAGEFLDTNPEFFLQQYGFVYHRDSVFQADDITWFLLEKR